MLKGIVMGDLAYDHDNDAWVEMGSTPGSTPVWWRTRGKRNRDGSYTDADYQPSQREKELAELRKRTEGLRAEIESLESQNTAIDAKTNIWDNSWLVFVIGLSVCGVLFACGYSTFATKDSGEMVSIFVLPAIVSLIGLIGIIYNLSLHSSRDRNKRRIWALKKELADLGKLY